MASPEFVRVTQHIYKLNVRCLGFQVGLFLVEDDGSWVVVDTGPANAVEVVLAAVEARTGGSPSHIILTHGHPDHTGCLQAMIDRWQVPVWAHELEIPYITGQACYGDINPAWWGYRMLGRVLDSQPLILPIVHQLNDGDRMDALKVLHVPGHAPGMIALLHAADHALLAGDAFRFKPIGGALPLLTYDRAEARHSMRKLADQDFDHLLVSHGAPIMGSGRQRALAMATGSR